MVALIANNQKQLNKILYFITRCSQPRIQNQIQTCNTVSLPPDEDAAIVHPDRLYRAVAPAWQCACYEIVSMIDAMLLKRIQAALFVCCLIRWAFARDDFKWLQILDIL